MMPKISLLVPVLNEEKNIDPFMSCISNQVVKPEVVFADGGSTDRTIEKINKYVSDPKLQVKLLILDRRGTGYAINMAFKESSGDYVIHAGVDWRFNDKNFFKKVIDTFASVNTNCVSVRHIVKPRSELGIIKNSFRFWDGRKTGGVGFLVVRRDCFPEYPNIAYGEDRIASQRIRALNPRYEYLRGDFGYERGNYKTFSFFDFVRRYIWYGKTYHLYLKECKNYMEAARILFAMATVILPFLLLIPAVQGILFSFKFARTYPATLFLFPVFGVLSSFFMGIGYILHFFDANIGH